MMSLPTAFARATGQLADPAILRVLAKSILVTLALFAALFAAVWALASRMIASFSGEFFGPGYAETLSGALTVVIALIAGWLLFRIVAIAVIQFFADEIVLAVEKRYYPGAHAVARDLPFAESLRESLKGLGRALGANLLALPIALLLLVTGIGTVLLFWLVNAWLLGRELQDIAWLRHRTRPGEAPPLNALTRFLLGGAVAALFAVPFLNLLAPVIGAAAATHLVHDRKESLADAL